ncbi:hypothetical protein CORC01_02289 [Colletotrichum orchidophilum]|uniref:Uncharacterized protein n=1 Tax=Colletotrichum orchidophilum TaxID=1209926 RepID=A0A1G4BLW2_9PEZI|nr:uncharacterized protein CORC01_02289 [Colletotrichum orchidophilum]OHF02296.1 hypothetical protein CORC01_02289 [Colletotrichum orchidophilum]
MTILKPIWNMTMRIQGFSKDGTHGQLWEVITVIKYFLSHFVEGWKTFYGFTNDDSSEESQEEEPVYSQPQPRQSLRPHPPPGYLHDSQGDPPAVQPSQQPHFNKAALPPHTHQKYIISISNYNDIGHSTQHLLQASINNG